MSWISEFAGKAETLLNRLDHQAASVLSGEEKKKKSRAGNVPRPEDYLQTVTTSLPSQPIDAVGSQPVTPSKGPLGRALREQTVEDELLTYLNDSSMAAIDDLEVGTKSSATMPVNAENEMLRNEVRSVNVEISLLLGRVKAAEAESSSAKAQLSRKDSEIDSLRRELSSLVSRVKSAENNYGNGFLENERLKLNYRSRHDQMRELEEKLAETQLEARTREEELRVEVSRMRDHVSELKGSLSVLSSERLLEVGELKGRIEENKNEFEDYKTRARKLLSDKETLIAHLKALGETSPTTTESLEVNQLREELETLGSALEKSEERVGLERSRAVEAAVRLDRVREELGAEMETLRGRLLRESERRLAADESCRARSEELHNVRDELTRRLGASTERLREKVEEVTILRRQIAQRKGDLTTEGKVSSLTTALVKKQAALEAMTNERNQYRLETERLKNSSHQYGSHLRGNVNDTDDAKAQVPAFMLESPLDTRVTRRVKRAYSSLDAVSVRTGTFLRRYPLARILLLSYGICLHLWVCLVLFTVTSTSPGANGI